MRTYLRAVALTTLAWALGVGWSGEAEAAERRLAVLELHDGAGLGAQPVTYLTDLVRQTVLKWQVPGLVLMTRENILALLPPGTELTECVGDCEVETARRIGAELVVAGEVVRFGGALRATLRLHEAASAKLVAAETAPAPDEAGLEPALAAAAAALGRALGGDRAGPAVAYVPASLPAVPALGAAPKGAQRTLGEGLSLRDVDVEALELYDRALALDAKGGVDSQQKADAWQKLAARPSSYQALASKRAAAWAERAAEERAVAQAKAERARLVAADWARIERLSRLRVVSDADKLRWLDDFIGAFGDEAAHREVVLKAKTLRVTLTQASELHVWWPLTERAGHRVTLTTIGGAELRGILKGLDEQYAYVELDGQLHKVALSLIVRAE